MCDDDVVVPPADEPNLPTVPRHEKQGHRRACELELDLERTKKGVTKVRFRLKLRAQFDDLVVEKIRRPTMAVEGAKYLWRTILRGGL